MGGAEWSGARGEASAAATTVLMVLVHLSTWRLFCVTEANIDTIACTPVIHGGRKSLGNIAIIQEGLRWYKRNAAHDDTKPNSLKLTRATVVLHARRAGAVSPAGSRPQLSE
ncbi:unnamed protein product [Schistocephalus solidus]|uniref:Secreted protein n=1 Tax=Schistocephalus solidus TaxID=70667 RepID=A0A183T8R4_SCHSO|nr:unnamed protein product [Schistocephalus solidus]